MQEAPKSLVIAALSDTHFGAVERPNVAPSLSEHHIAEMSDRADLIIHCGDFVDFGSIDGAYKAVRLFRRSEVPVIGVLGNHDYNLRRPGAIEHILEEGGITLLRGDVYSQKIDGTFVNFLGVPGQNRKHTKIRPSGTKVSTETFERIDQEYQQFARRIDSLKGKNNVVFLHFQPARRAKSYDDGKTHAMRVNTYGQLIEAHKSRIKLVLHGHDHVNGSSATAVEGVDMINVASPVTVAMTPNVPYRLIQIPLQ